MTLEARVTGRLDAASIVGTGHLEGGTLSFIGYNQLFEGSARTRSSAAKRSLSNISRGEAEAATSTDGERFRSDGPRGSAFTSPWTSSTCDILTRRIFIRCPGARGVDRTVEDLLVAGDVEVQSARYTRVLYPRKRSSTSAGNSRTSWRGGKNPNSASGWTSRRRGPHHPDQEQPADIKAGGEFKVEGDTRKVIVLGPSMSTKGTSSYTAAGTT